MMRKMLVTLIIFLMMSAGTKAQQHFLRSRWIAERMNKAHFSGAVIPDMEISEESGNDEMASTIIVPSAVVEVRVSQDILTGSAGNAQPETQAEPMIAINPERSANLLAGYQDNRFRTGGARALTYATS